MNSVLSSNIINYKLSLDNTNNKVLGSFMYTTVGLVTVVVNVNKAQVTCPTCSVTYKPAAIALQRTRFFTVSSMGVNSTSKASLESGRTDLNLLAQLFDKYDNAIQELTSDDTFSMVLSGNNMNSMDMSIERGENSTNSLDITVLAEKASDFSLLVPADNYNMTLTYLYQKKVNQTAALLLQLSG